MERVENNGLKFYTKRDLFADQLVGLFLLFFFQLQLRWTYEFFISYFVILKIFYVPIWALPILGAHLFFGSNLS